MNFFRSLGLVALACAVLHAQPPVEDPVMKARSQRAQAQGLSEGDLPPVPKGIIEPPPLPPPELHVRDMARTSSRGRTIKVSRRKSIRRGRAVKAESKKLGRKTKAAPKQAKVRKKGKR
ncbi:MAG: hypothetical protein H6Q00_61 [Holophagaceae bacterium]|nr:hypothetical protein [Holophagaceae bacterium]